MSARTIFHVSDIHFGAADPAALAWFAQAVADIRPDGVICTGDLTMRARHSEFAAAAAWLDALAVPVMVQPGNHDLPYFNLVERFSHPFARYRRLRQAVSRQLVLDDIAIIALSTLAAAQWRLDWSKGRVGRAGLAHALSALSALSATTGTGIRIVACHHPLVAASTATPASTRGGARALAALAQAGADVVLTGHIHDAFDIATEAGGRPIRLIGAGTLSKRLRSTRPSFNRLDYEPGHGLRVTLQSMPG